MIHSQSFEKNVNKNSKYTVASEESEEEICEKLIIIKMESRSGKQKHSEEKEIDDLTQDYEKIMAKPSNVDFASHYLFDSLLKTAIFEVSIRSHFEARYKKEDLYAGSLPITNDSVDAHLVSCSSCQKVVDARKFASHLGKKELLKHLF